MDLLMNPSVQKVRSPVSSFSWRWCELHICPNDYDDHGHEGNYDVEGDGDDFVEGDGDVDVEGDSDDDVEGDGDDVEGHENYIGCCCVHPL